MFNRAWGKRALSLAAVAAAAAASLTASPLRAATLVNDTWIDGTDTDPAATVYSENGVDADGDGNIESAWFQGGVGTLNPVGANGPLRGDLGVGGTSSASWTTYFAPEGSPVTLQQGETLRVTWRFTPTNINSTSAATGNTSQNFRIALVDTPSSARITAADAAPADAAFTGYAMFMNMSPTLGNSSPFRLMERAAPTTAGNLLATGGNWAALGTTGATTGNDGYDSGVPYEFVMELTRTPADALDIVATMTGGTLDNDGVASVVFTDTTPNGGSFTFDTFGIRPSGATTTAELFDTTLFRVEHVVPEPSSLALLGAGALGLMRRRRSRRA